MRVDRMDLSMLFEDCGFCEACGYGPDDIPDPGCRHTVEEFTIQCSECLAGEDA